MELAFLKRILSRIYRFKLEGHHLEIKRLERNNLEREGLGNNNLGK